MVTSVRVMLKVSNPSTTLSNTTDTLLLLSLAPALIKILSGVESKSTPDPKYLVDIHT